MKKEKIIVSDIWSEKYLREAVWMPFGSMSNIIAQSYNGKEIEPQKLKELTQEAFDLAMEFTKEAFLRVQRGKTKELELPKK